MAAVKVECRNCSNKVEADKFVLSPNFKFMVCPECARGRSGSFASKTGAREAFSRKEGLSSQKVDRPAGWDEEDEYLERVQKEKPKKPSGIVSSIDKERVLYRCPGCKYQFTYNLRTRTPKSCHYCDSEIFE